MHRKTIGLAALALALVGCAQEPDGTSDAAEPMAEGTKVTRDQGGAAVPGDTDDRRAFSEIAPEERVNFTGTEPFWGGEVTGTSLTYSTPENIDGTTIEVERFAGRGGVSFGGQYEGAPFDMMITPGKCSDGMSDRTYPYTVTLAVKGEQRSGCAWTEDSPHTVPPGMEP